MSNLRGKALSPSISTSTLILFVVSIFCIISLISCSKSTYEGPAIEISEPGGQPTSPEPFFVVSVTPADGETGVFQDAVVRVRFSYPPAAGNVTNETFRLIDETTNSSVVANVEPVIEEPESEPTLFQLTPTHPLQIPFNPYRIELSSCISSIDREPIDFDLSEVPLPSSFETEIGPDTVPPRFLFYTISAIPLSSTSVSLSWPLAFDVENRTPPPLIYYAVYAGADSNNIDFETPVVVTMPGITKCTVTGLSPNTLYYFVIHPIDEAGNEDDNNIVITARTFLSEDSRSLTILYSSDVFATLEPCG